MPKATCKVDGCERVGDRGRGYCGPHYKRWRRNGDPGSAEIQRRNPGALCVVPDCDRKSFARGYCQTHAYRLRQNGDPLVTRPPGSPAGESHPAYRGDDVGYAAVHRRLRKWQGSARDHLCSMCDGPAQHWAYQHTDPNERIDDRAGLPYTTDLTHYRPMCASCHNQLDAVHGWLNRQESRGASYVARLGLWRAYASINGQQRYGGHHRTREAALEAARDLRSTLRPVLLDQWVTAVLEESL